MRFASTSTQIGSNLRLGCHKVMRLWFKGGKEEEKMAGCCVASRPGE